MNKQYYPPPPIFQKIRITVTFFRISVTFLKENRVFFVFDSQKL